MSSTDGHAAWAALIAAGACEVAATTAFRYVEGFTRLVPTMVFFAVGLASLVLLNRAIATIPIGTAYAVWTGIGAAGTVLVGLAFHGEPATTGRLLLLMLLIGSIIGLKLVSAD
jgi:quaternary ammonium compound-resistance protein SugE